MNLYRLTLLSLLASLATVGRFLFSFYPNVQPVTAIIIICGIWLGPSYSVILAILTTILSNMLLGMGIWTLPQIVSWSLIGLLAGLLGKYRHKIPLYGFAFFAGMSGYFFGFIMAVTYGQIGNHFFAYWLTSLPFDTYHAVGNVVFMVILYPVLSRLFQLYEKKNFKSFSRPNQTLN
ncbi:MULTISPECIES: ECF transporter S component [Pontibacillus]|uniref:ECF transporter S component n=1 Tax=Pontibacillus chungwhensis TaxID=265426 RepID=A0ABY8UVM4_9BACI|nr:MULTISPECIES: ECF transporter S component [Pontibacillus]MCD5323036.1 ECF transporter S component [Pontibacillus sp. HN14]WIF96429.1 ECF transporter S component [Pontibacillus chungwhensis]